MSQLAYVNMQSTVGMFCILYNVIFSICGPALAV